MCLVPARERAIDERYSLLTLLRGTRPHSDTGRQAVAGIVVQAVSPSFSWLLTSATEDGLLDSSEATILRSTFFMRSGKGRRDLCRIDKASGPSSASVSEFPDST